MQNVDSLVGLQTTLGIAGIISVPPLPASSVALRVAAIDIEWRKANFRVEVKKSKGFYKVETVKGVDKGADVIKLYQKEVTATDGSVTTEMTLGSPWYRSS